MHLGPAHAPKTTGRLVTEYNYATVTFCDKSDAMAARDAMDGAVVTLDKRVRAEALSVTFASGTATDQSDDDFDDDGGGGGSGGGYRRRRRRRRLRRRHGRRRRLRRRLLLRSSTTRATSPTSSKSAPPRGARTGLGRQKSPRTWGSMRPSPAARLWAT